MEKQALGQLANPLRQDVRRSKKVCNKAQTPLFSVAIVWFLHLLHFANIGLLGLRRSRLVFAESELEFKNGLAHFSPPISGHEAEKAGQCHVGFARDVGKRRRGDLPKLAGPTPIKKHLEFVRRGLKRAEKSALSSCFANQPR